MRAERRLIISASSFTLSRSFASTVPYEPGYSPTVTDEGDRHATTKVERSALVGVAAGCAIPLTIQPPWSAVWLCWVSWVMSWGLRGSDAGRPATMVTKSLMAAVASALDQVTTPA